MNEKELVKKIAGQFFLTKVESKEIIQLILTQITNALKNGDRVYFRGFGSFTKAKRSAKKVRHPRTRKMITIPARVTAHFKPSLLFLKNLE